MLQRGLVHVRQMAFKLLVRTGMAVVGLHEMQVTEKTVGRLDAVRPFPHPVEVAEPAATVVDHLETLAQSEFGPEKRMRHEGPGAKVRVIEVFGQGRGRLIQGAGNLFVQVGDCGAEPPAAVLHRVQAGEQAGYRR